MTIYQPGIPTGSVPLNQDYQNIQNNFTQLDTSFGVDHVPFSTAMSNGYHRVIRQVPFSTTTTNPPDNYPVSQAAVPPSAPPTIGGIGQLFTAQTNDGIDLDETLYFLTGGSELIQLTRNITPKNPQNGYSFLPGGLLMQWGVITAPGAGTILTQFITNNINFPNACYNVFITVDKSSSLTRGVSVNSINATQFAISINGADLPINFVYWMAIGN